MGRNNPREIEIPLMIWDGLNPAQKVMHYHGHTDDGQIEEEHWKDLLHFNNDKLQRLVRGTNAYTINARERSGKKVQFQKFTSCFLK